MGYAVDPKGNTDSTNGIQKALYDCYYAGGGTVFLPAGEYLITDTIYIPSYVTLRGDYQDPDEVTEGDMQYGTILCVKDEAVDSTSTGTITLSGSSGAVGLTIYYPSQSLDEVVPYPYTFYVPIGTDGARVMTIQDVTVINGYRGIGTQYDLNHECLNVDNFKGTFLHTGLALHNQSDVGRYHDVTISSKYWAETNIENVQIPEQTDVKNYTKNHTTGILGSTLEWTTFSNITIEDCNKGIHFVQGLREDYQSISAIDIKITDCGTGILVDENAMDTRWGSVIARSSIDGAIENNAVSLLKMTDVDATIQRQEVEPLFVKDDFELVGTWNQYTPTGTATGTHNGVQETFAYRSFSPDTQSRVIITNESPASMDLSQYQLENLALEFWMKASDATTISLPESSYLWLGTGTLAEAPRLSFRNSSIKLNAGEWTKISLNLSTATNVGELVLSNPFTWTRMAVMNVGTSNTISISDMKIVETNMVEIAEDDLGNYTINYDATYTKPQSQLFVANLKKGSTTDVSEALQKVLDEAGTQGGGIVYVPGGTYRFDNPITVPAGVELRGASAVANREQRTYNGGTLFLCYYGDTASYDADSDDAFITLAGENAGLSGLRVIYPENGPYDTDLNTTYTVRGKASGVYVVNCYIMASAYGVDFKECDNHFIKGVYSCCWMNTFRLGGANGVIRDCLHNGNMVTRTNAQGLPENWPEENVLTSLISDQLLRPTAQYILLDGADGELVCGVSACSIRDLLINRNSSNTLVVNVCSDKMGTDGVQFTQEGGSMTVINAMRHVGTSYSCTSGTLRLFNRIAINITDEENAIIGD